MPRFLISLLFILNGAVLLMAVLAGDFFLSPGIKAVLNVRKEIVVRSADSLQANQFKPGNTRSDIIILRGDSLFLIFEEGDTLFCRKGGLGGLLSAASPGQKLAVYSLSHFKGRLYDSPEHQPPYWLPSQPELDYLTGLLSTIRNPFFIDRMKYNDHVISDRCEALVMLAARVQDEELSNTILRQAAVDLDLLMDDRFFTWNSNHGLMQIRAMLNMSSAVTDRAYSREISEKANERLASLLDFLTAEDGSVLEAASGYWHYIFQELVNIGAHERISESNKEKLTRRTAAIAVFLADMADNHGIIPGIGDSYDFRLDDTVLRLKRQGSGIVSYSNSLCSYEENYPDGYLKVIFLSLDNPPNAHKHPADLQLLIAAPDQLFANTGIYNYDKSENRKTVLAEASQGTVRFGDFHGAPLNSSVGIESIKSTRGRTIARFTGTKIYEKGTVIREIEVHTNSDTLLTVRDHSKPPATLVSAFNLRQGVDYAFTGDTVTLGESIQILLSSANTFESDEVMISDRPDRMTAVTQIRFTGEDIRLVFKTTESRIPRHDGIYIQRDPEKNSRSRTAGVLRHRYDRFYLTRRQLAFSASLLIIIDFLLIFSFFMMKAGVKRES